MTAINPSDLKLAALRSYIEDMFPIFRIQILLPHDDMVRNEGYDLAMHKAQKELLEILDAD